MFLFDVGVEGMRGRHLSSPAMSFELPCPGPLSDPTDPIRSGNIIPEGPLFGDKREGDTIIPTFVDKRERDIYHTIKNLQ